MIGGTKRWHVHCGRDLSQGLHIWTLGLYWHPDPIPIPSRLRWQRYVELCLNTSNPFWLHHRLK